jgi:hypothetical protein
MNSRSTTADLKRELRRLFRSMDFVSRHPALKRAGPEAERLAEIYQQLGLAWEFLALQCRHRGGWRETRAGKSACKVCGLIRGARESWFLLPREGKKRVGYWAMPTSKGTFPNRKAATVVNDAIDFHGARLQVEVLNEHRSQSRWFRKHDWTIAADRLVRLEEGGVEVRFDTCMVSVEVRKHKRGAMPPYSHFAWELPRKLLRRFPVMLQFDKRRRFTGLVVFKPLDEGNRGKQKHLDRRQRTKRRSPRPAPGVPHGGGPSQ